MTERDTKTPPRLDDLRPAPASVAKASHRRISGYTSTRVALLTSLSALAVATNYAMLPLLNIKLMDSVVFVAGLSFGASSGCAVATVAWLVYGTLNPYGFSLPTLLTVILSEMIYAIAGGAMSHSWLGPKGGEFKPWVMERNIGFGVVGLLSTLAYDLVTNAVTGWLYYGSAWIGLLTMNFPLPMGILHEASNLFLFALVAPPLAFSVSKYTSRKSVSVILPVRSRGG